MHIQHGLVVKEKAEGCAATATRLAAILELAVRLQAASSCVQNGIGGTRAVVWLLTGERQCNCTFDHRRSPILSCARGWSASCLRNADGPPVDYVVTSRNARVGETCMPSPKPLSETAMSILAFTACCCY